MPLVYGIGLGFAFGAVGSFILLFFFLKVSLKPFFVPKADENKGISVEELISESRKFFTYREEKLREITESEDLGTPLRPAFVIKGIMLSKTFKGVFIKEGDKIIFVEEGKSYKGYRLARVEREKAIFEKGGKLFTLKFELVRGGTNLSINSENTSNTREIVISRREIESITRDPAKMFTQIRLVPYIKEGKTKGFIFEWVKPGSLFYRLGIRRGDILVSINNMTITSGEDAFRILQMIRNEPSLKVVLIRRGKREEIDVRIE